MPDHEARRPPPSHTHTHTYTRARANTHERERNHSNVRSSRALSCVRARACRACRRRASPCTLPAVPLPLRAQGLDTAAAEDRILALCRALDSEPRVRVGVSFLSTAPSPFKSRLLAVNWERVELKENSEWALPRPNLGTLGLPAR